MPQPQGARREWGTDLGEAIAVLRPEPDQLASAGLHFDSGYDDLDHVRVALVKAPSGAVYALVRHEQSSSPGTEVMVRSPQPAAIIASDLEGILRRLGLGRDVVTWIRPDLQQRSAQRRSLVRLAEAVLGFLGLKTSRNRG
jgi:hypothetical protein